jgi:DNA invertase Pin-like site-specific DNA recombinase
MNTTPNLRFAALVRVSTERQAKEGESLRTQRSQIESAAQQIGGSVVGWYGGQEHATPGWEKSELDRLLMDAASQHKRFDAVIVTHPDRWSRDNEVAKRGLNLLRSKQIKFFVGSAEQNLFDPNVCLFLGMATEIGEFQARLQSQKSLQNRIARAKTGAPTAGKLPFGRKYNRVTGTWEIDSEKQRIILDVARRYLAGESMAKLAKEHRLNHASLHKTLTQRCGTKWEQKFDLETAGIHESVTIDIPPLLSPGIIQQILSKVKGNKKFNGKPKNKWLLSGMLVCAHCGYRYFGQMNRTGHGYYRHAHTERKNSCACSKGWLRADALEADVVEHLFDLFGNPVAVERAIELAMPNLDATRQLQNRIGQLDALIDKENHGRQRVLRHIDLGTVSEAEATNLLAGKKTRIKELQEERDRLRSKLPNAPTISQVKQAAKLVASRFNRKRVTKADVKANARLSGLTNIETMTWGDKREFLEHIFAGPTPEGKPAGIYVSWPKGKGQPYKYTMNGIITRTETGALPPELTKSPDTGAKARSESAVIDSALHWPTATPPECRSFARRLRSGL